MSTSSSSPAVQKAQLRLDMKAARFQFNEAQRARAALSLCHSLWPWLSRHKHQSVGVYLARSFELSLDPLIEALLESGAQVGAPCVNVDTQTMGFFRLPFLDDVQTGPWNVREPCSGEAFSPSVILVPALALDAQGNRLGTGGGWYDRFLPPSVLAIGVVFDFQFVARVPVEDHDRTMNHVWSEKRHFDCAA